MSAVGSGAHTAESRTFFHMDTNVIFVSKAVCLLLDKLVLSLLTFWFISNEVEWKYLDNTLCHFMVLLFHSCNSDKQAIAQHWECSLSSDINVCPGPY